MWCPLTDLMKFGENGDREKPRQKGRDGDTERERERERERELEGETERLITYNGRLASEVTMLRSVPESDSARVN